MLGKPRVPPALQNLLLIDLRMPGMGGIAVLNALQKFERPPFVMVLTSFQKEEDIYRPIRAGAQGYLKKDTTEVEIVAAISVVLDGSGISPAILPRGLPIG